MTALRVAALFLGTLMVLSSGGVYVFDLLPASAPEDAGLVLFIIAAAGAWMAFDAATEDAS